MLCWLYKPTTNNRLCNVLFAGKMSSKLPLSNNDEPLHIVMFPWLAFGHMLPFFQLSKHLAKRGNRVSFVSTPRNISRLPKIPPDLASLLHYVELPFPRHAENIPDGAESTNDIPADKIPYLVKAMDGLQQPLANFLESVSPHWIVYDFVHHWLPPVASKLGVQQVYFCTSSAAFLSFLGPPSRFLESEYEGPHVKPDDFTASPKWIPFEYNLHYRKFEVMNTVRALLDEVEHDKSLYRMAIVPEKCHIVVVRTDAKIESECLTLLQQKIYQKPVLPVGVLAPCLLPEDGDAKWDEIREWLDHQETKAVVYVSFGSEPVLSPKQAIELSIGLELSKIPFLWVCKNGLDLPTGFVERVRGRGFICETWARQLRILSHPSVGCFLTHCGWSSVIESLSFGCPLVLLPLISDQPINARLLVWKKIAFEIPRDESSGWFSRESVAESLKKLMVDEEGEMYKIEAKELKEVFGDPTTQDKYIEEFHLRLKEFQGNKGNR